MGDNYNQHKMQPEEYNLMKIGGPPQSPYPASAPLTHQPMPQGMPYHQGMPQSQGMPQPQGMPTPYMNQPMPQPPGTGPQYANQPPGTGPQYANQPPMQGGVPSPYPVPPQANWMAMPQQIAPDCPPGLEYLTLVDQLIVKQTVELLEIFTGFESSNRYVIKNSVGQKVYYAKEESNFCARNCCGSLRGFEMRIVDNTGRHVIHLDRPYACQSCCCPCCLQTMEVFSPPGCLIGSIEQNWSLIFPSFTIKNAHGDVVLRIKGPCCTSNCCCSDVEFDVLSSNGEVKVGKISKQWTGIVKESFTDADNFGITFPMDLDVKMKAVMLGACFLIDMMFFEQKAADNKTNVTFNHGSPEVDTPCWACCFR